MRSSVAYDEASGVHVYWHVGNQRFELDTEDQCECTPIVIPKAVMLALLDNVDEIRAYAARSVE